VLLARNRSDILVLVSIPSEPGTNSKKDFPLMREPRGRDRESTSVSKLRDGDTAKMDGRDRARGGGAADNPNISAFVSNVYGASALGLSRSVAQTLDSCLDGIVLVGEVEGRGDAAIPYGDGVGKEGEAEGRDGRRRGRERVVEVVRDRNGANAGLWIAW
jgi:hypothetical protein